MSGLNYYIIDTETNGLNSKIQEINEISIIRCSDRVQQTILIRCEHPEHSSVDALRITGKTIEDLQNGISKEEAIVKVDKFLNEDGLTPAHRIFVAHNGNFDRKFLHALYKKVNKQCPVNLWLCTIELSRKYAKEMGLTNQRFNLNAACELVGIKKVAGAHASKADARNTYLLWKDLVENKKVDYLPLIKTIPHIIDIEQEDGGLDPDLMNY